MHVIREAMRAAPPCFCVTSITIRPLGRLNANAQTFIRILSLSILMVLGLRDLTTEELSSSNHLVSFFLLMDRLLLCNGDHLHFHNNMAFN